MLRLVLDHLKTKKTSRNLIFVIRYNPDRCKTQEIYDRVIPENDGRLMPVLDCYKNQKYV